MYDAEHVPLEVEPCRRTDLPVAAQETFLLDEAQSVQRCQIAWVRFQKDLVVEDAGANERRALAEFRADAELCGQFIRRIGPMDFSVDADEVPQESRALRDGIASILVNPPRDEARHP